MCIFKLFPTMSTFKTFKFRNKWYFPSKLSKGWIPKMSVLSSIYFVLVLCSWPVLFLLLWLRHRNIVEIPAPQVRLFLLFDTYWRFSNTSRLAWSLVYQLYTRYSAANMNGLLCSWQCMSSDNLKAACSSVLESGLIICWLKLTCRYFSPP